MMRRQMRGIQNVQLLWSLCQSQALQCECLNGQFGDLFMDIPVRLSRFCINPLHKLGVDREPGTVRHLFCLLKKCQRSRMKNAQRQVSVRKLCEQKYQALGCSPYQWHSSFSVWNTWCLSGKFSQVHLEWDASLRLLRYLNQITDLHLNFELLSLICYRLYWAWESLAIRDWTGCPQAAKRCSTFVLCYCFGSNLVLCYVIILNWKIGLT